MAKPVRRNADQYWATLPIDKFGGEVMRRIEDYYQFLWSTGKTRLYRNAYQYYYRPGLIGGKVTTAGSEGELVTISVNHYRNLIQHLLVMTVSQPPSWEPQATNTDQKSQEQCILARGLLEYYMREKKCSRNLTQAVEMALLLGEGFVVASWDATTGEQYGVNPETQAIIYQGDIQYRTLTALDVIRDVNKDSAFENDWVITRTWKNRWDLMAKYPELADQISKVTDSDWDTITWKDTRLYLYEKYNYDDVPVYTFYHRETEAMPQGRMATMLNYKIVLDDGPIPYRNIPVYRISPSEWMGTNFGYTSGFDLLPIQQMIDSLYSAAATNNTTFGVQNIWTKKGDTLEANTLAGGMRHLQSDQKPEPLNLTQTSPELYKLVEMMQGIQETLSGVNSVARGNPQQALGSDASGAALALLQSMSIQFSMGLQASFADLVEDVGTATINILRDYAQTPRVAAITGKANRQYMKSFTGDDLSMVNRVTVDMGNPAMSTTAGKVNMANQLLQSDKLADAAQYIEVVQTGKLEPVIEGEQAQLMLIRGENEQLSQGMPQQALITDNPMLHISEHLTVISSPEARNNLAVVQATLSHIQEHRDLYSQMDPVMCAILNIPPPPPPLMPMMQPGMPMDPNQPMPQGPPSTNPQMQSPQSPAMQQASQVKQPSMPKPPKNTPPQNAQIINSMPPPPQIGG